MSIYRRIYEEHYGPIPKDSDGRTYEIHHIDGNHKNDSPINLTALSIQEHYNIHYDKGDYGAAQAIAIRMRTSPEEISRLARLAQLKRVEDGTHNFLDGEISTRNNLRRVAEGTNPFVGGELQRCNNLKRVAEGTHHLLGGKIQREAALKRVAEGTNPFCGPESNRRRIANGTHNFLDSEKQRTTALKRVEDGTNPFLNPITYICPHCGKIGKGGAMFRYHFDKCKSKL